MTRERPIRNLALLMQGQFVSNMGNQIFDIAMLLWIKELTGSAAIMGLAMLLTGLPTALLAPFGGSIADRFGHLRVVILSDLVSALAVGCVVAVVLLQPDPALLYYDRIGLLVPTARSQAGYRMYDEAAVVRLRHERGRHAELAQSI